MTQNLLDNDLTKQPKTTPWLKKRLYIFHFCWIVLAIGILFGINIGIGRSQWLYHNEFGVYGTWWLLMGTELIGWNYIRLQQALKPTLIASLLTAILTAISVFVIVSISISLIDNSNIDTFQQLGAIVFFMLLILIFCYGAITIGIAHLIERKLDKNP